MILYDYSALNYLNLESINALIFNKTYYTNTCVRYEYSVVFQVRLVNHRTFPMAYQYLYH